MEVVVAGAAAVEAAVAAVVAVAAEVVEAVESNPEHGNICSRNQVCPPQCVTAMACD
jgi:hypothetical protein